MSVTPKDAIVWIDCEMTGLDVEADALIEVAVIVTDSELNPLDDGVDVVITPPERALATMVDLVRRMHTSSGLLPALADGVSLEEATRIVLDYIKGHVPTARKAPIAGNSVGTDRAFLERHMPAVTDHLHYRVIDVSSIKELVRRWYPRAYFASPPKRGGHRALADIRESIAELRYYRAVLFPAGEGPDIDTCRLVAREIAGLAPEAMADVASADTAPSPEAAVEPQQAPHRPGPA